MDEAERLARVAQLREAAMTVIREENNRMAREAARDRCDQCSHAKRKRDEEVTLPNGLRLAVCAAHCSHPGLDCTALVRAHLLSEPPEVANRMVEHLAALPELAAVGVGWLACIAPGADRFILTYRVPASTQVTRVIGALRAEAFRK